MRFGFTEHSINVAKLEFSGSIQLQLSKVRTSMQRVTRHTTALQQQIYSWLFAHAA